MLVWIGKADGGNTNESWRPLNLAVTFLRAISGVVEEHVSRHWKDALHPAQALAGRFREAHANYRKAQDELDRKENAFCGVFQADLMKAFELINPYWVKGVLRARGAPRWLKQWWISLSSRGSQSRRS